MEIDTTVIFMIDTEYYYGKIKRIDDKTADILTYIGLIKNIPVSEINLP
jgi:hypothetical protein